MSPPFPPFAAFPPSRPAAPGMTGMVNTAPPLLKPQDAGLILPRADVSSPRQSVATNRPFEPRTLIARGRYVSEAARRVFDPHKGVGHFYSRVSGVGKLS
jgi:hypothetical protein